MKKFVIFITIMFLLIALASGGTFAFLMRYYNYTFIEAVNKVAATLEFVAEQERFINYNEKYQTDYQSTFWINNNQSKIFPFINNKSKSEVRAYFTERVSVLNNRRALGLGCQEVKQRTILQAYYCVIRGELQLEKLISRLLNFKFEQPKEVGTYGNALEFAFAYELLLSSFDLSAEVKTKLQSQLKKMLSSYLSKLDGDSASLFHGRSVLASNAIILASLLDVSHTQNKYLISRAVGHYKDFYDALRKVVIWPEGYNYWINERALPIIIGLEAYKYAVVNDQSHSKDVTSLQIKIGHWHIYNTRPDWTIQGWGDEGPRVDLKDETAKVIDYLAVVTESPEIEVYARLLAKKFGRAAYWRGYRQYLPIFGSTVWFDPTFSYKGDASTTLEPLKYLLPLSAIFGPGFSNHVVIRSGWGADDTFIQLRASQTFTHHQHYDAGHFTIFKKEPLIVNASSYSGLDNENRMYFASRSISKNTIKIMNHDETFKPDRHYDKDTPDGGQRVPVGLGSSVPSFKAWEKEFKNGKYQNSQLLRYELDKQGNVFVEVDITNAYNSIRYSADSDDTKVSRVVRNFAYINSIETVLLFDEVVTTDSKFPVMGTFFMPTQPTNLGLNSMHLGMPNDGVFTTNTRNFFIKNSKANLTLSSLSESYYQCIVIGGEQYRNFVLYSPDLASPRGNILDGGYKVKRWNEQAEWRVEVPFNQNGKWANSIVALRPGSLETPKLVETNLKYTIWALDNIGVVSINDKSEEHIVIESLAGLVSVVFISSEAGEVTVTNMGNGTEEIFHYNEGITIVHLEQNINNV